MTTVNVRDTRENLSSLLDAVAAGDEVLIVRRGRPVARLVAPESRQVSFRSREALRKELPPMRSPAAEQLRALRNEERY